jgi:hypothetical protein
MNIASRIEVFIAVAVVAIISAVSFLLPAAPLIPLTPNHAPRVTRVR